MDLPTKLWLSMVIYVGLTVGKRHVVRTFHALSINNLVCPERVNTTEERRHVLHPLLLVTVLLILFWLQLQLCKDALLSTHAEAAY